MRRVMLISLNSGGTMGHNKLITSPKKLEEHVIKCSKGLSLITLLRQLGKAKSNSDARRLIEQGGVRLNGNLINDVNYVVSPRDGQIIQVGKRYFRRLKYEKDLEYL